MQAGGVYILANRELGFYKIGWSREVETRLAQLAERMPFDLELMRKWDVESAFHQPTCASATGSFASTHCSPKAKQEQLQRIAERASVQGDVLGDRHW